jgi:uncharacterized protein (DUF488 family)
MKVFTIGFTKSTAQSFFDRLQRAGVKKVLDVRLNNVSQLAGFAKRDDLRYFLEAIGGIAYEHERAFAPTQEMLDAYKKHKGDWAEYERRFIDLMAERRIEEALPREALADACLLCSEDKPHHCHRRLVAEYLREKWGEVDIAHL